MLALMGKTGITNRVRNKGSMPRISTRKLKELILYIAQKSDGDIKFGSTKLNKLLLFSDMLYFAETGGSITGVKYEKKQFGPVPTNIYTVKNEMISRDGSMVVVPKEEAIGMVRKVPTALRRPDLTVFTAEEIATVDAVIRTFEDLNNSEISAYSHNRIANWDYIPIGHEVPLSVILYPAKTKLTSEDKSFFRNLLRSTEWGQQLIHARGAEA